MGLQLVLLMDRPAAAASNGCDARQKFPTESSTFMLMAEQLVACGIMPIEHVMMQLMLKSEFLSDIAPGLHAANLL